MKYLEDSRLTQLTSDLTEAFLNTRQGIEIVNCDFLRHYKRVKKINKTAKNNDDTTKNAKNNKSAKGTVKNNAKNNRNAKNNSLSVPYSSSYYSNNNTFQPFHNSCNRVIFGRVEAYTTKRAGNDKKTAHIVGTKYAHEMERLKEAVEDTKRAYLLRRKLEEKKDGGEVGCVEEGNDGQYKSGRREKEGQKGAQVESQDKSQAEPQDDSDNLQQEQQKQTDQDDMSTGQSKDKQTELQQKQDLQDDTPEKKKENSTQNMETRQLVNKQLRSSQETSQNHPDELVKKNQERAEDDHIMHTDPQPQQNQHVKDEKKRQRELGTKQQRKEKQKEKGNLIPPVISSNRIRNRTRSRSVDYVVTFADSSRTINAPSTSSPKDDQINEINQIDNTTQTGETSEINEIAENKQEGCKSTKRRLESILRPPKRWRATSFDISTGPSNLSYHPIKTLDEFYPDGAYYGYYPSRWSEGHHPLYRPHHHSLPALDDEHNLRPLIPQPSLYQSNIAESSSHCAPIESLPPMIPRRLVTDLILTLNASFPDYDFGDARPSDFVKLRLRDAVKRVEDKLAEFATTSNKGRHFLPRLWNALDDVLFGWDGCEVYSYAPRADGGDDDPLGFLTTTLVGAEESDGDIGNRTSASDCILIPSKSNRRHHLSSNTLDLPHRIPPSHKSFNPGHVTLWTMNYFFVSHDKKRIVLLTCVQTMRTPRGNYDDEYYHENMNVGDDYGENDLVFDEARKGVAKENSIGSNAYYSFPMMTNGMASGAKGANNLSSAPAAGYRGSNVGTGGMGNAACQESVAMVEDDGDDERALRGAAAEDTDFEDYDDHYEEDDQDENEEFDMDDETGPGTLGMSVRPPSPLESRVAMA